MTIEQISAGIISVVAVIALLLACGGETPAGPDDLGDMWH